MVHGAEHPDIAHQLLLVLHTNLQQPGTEA